MVGILTERLLDVAGVLCQDVCWLHRGRFHFALGGDWTLAISVESANRLRIDACHRGRVVDTLWVRQSDRARLAELATDLAAATALTA